VKGKRRRRPFLREKRGRGRNGERGRKKGKHSSAKVEHLCSVDGGMGGRRGSAIFNSKKKNPANIPLHREKPPQLTCVVSTYDLFKKGCPLFFQTQKIREFNQKANKKGKKPNWVHFRKAQNSFNYLF